jgi:hypothetical protein
MSDTADPRTRINEFLDGQLAPSEREVFLKLLSEDAQLRAAYEQQCAIDTALRRIFREDPSEKLLERVETSLLQNGNAPPRFQTKFHLWRSLAVAALLAFSIAGLWYSWSVTRPTPVVDVYKAQPWRSFATVYYDTIRDGFKPAWVCRNELQFETAFSRRFRQPLLLAALPSGITAGGISYSNTLSPATINVLGRVEGTPVMVFVDKRAVDHGPPPPAPSELHLFRREIDDLVLYELTPLDRANILPYFYRPHKD